MLLLMYASLLSCYDWCVYLKIIDTALYKSDIFKGQKFKVLAVLSLKIDIHEFDIYRYVHIHNIEEY